MKGWVFCRDLDYFEESVNSIITQIKFYSGCRNLQVSGYIRSPSKTSSLNTEELEVFNMLRRALLIALRHTRYEPQFIA